MNELTFDILKIVISVCAALVTVYVIPYLKTLKEDRRYAQILDMVEVAVRAAEQTIKGAGKGIEKKEKVENIIYAWLMERGIEISTEQINQLIECAVYQLKQGQ